MVRSVGKRRVFSNLFLNGQHGFGPYITMGASPLNSRRALLRHRSPVSGSITTINLPLFSGLAATFKAAQVAAPLNIPTTNPLL